jgi:hypothetical protein
MTMGTGWRAEGGGEVMGRTLLLWPELGIEGVPLMLCDVEEEIDGPLSRRGDAGGADC